MSMCFAFLDVPCRVAMLLPAVESVCMRMFTLDANPDSCRVSSSVVPRLFLCKLRRVHFLLSSVLL